MVLMDDATAHRYLTRIGAVRPARPDAAALTDLMGGHLATVPFENLSIHLGEPIRLDEETLLAKIIDRRRGGFCYELNGAFAALLRHLGFDVTQSAARVATPIGLGPPFDHLVLRVDLAERWLVDVGFGRLTRRPVRWDERAAQRDVEGLVVLSDTAEGDLAVALDGVAQYVVEPRPRRLSDFGPTCWWQQTSPESHFTQSLTCSLPTREGRITLSGRRLIRTVAGERTEQELGSDDEVLATYRSMFGITLDRVPAMREAEVPPSWG